uniref:Uncharacterized protein n=1 Tax=Strigamia maritima TaxID=126957 RepID=T1JM58_STRMM
MFEVFSLEKNMNKFAKKYVCYDPNLTRFSELGNVALNKTFWERTYATTRKFSLIMPGLSDSTVPCVTGDTFDKIKKPKSSTLKIKSSQISSISNCSDKDQISKGLTAKITAGYNESYTSNTAKKLKTLIILPKPPLSSPYDECWPQTTLAATQSLPNVKHLHPLSSASCAQRRVSRLPSLSKIVEQDTDKHHRGLTDSYNVKQYDSEKVLVSSYDSPSPQSETFSKGKLKIMQKNMKEKIPTFEKSLIFTDDTMYSSRSCTKGSSSVKPSAEAVIITSESAASLSPSALIAMDRAEFWNERRPKKVPPPMREFGKVSERKKAYSCLVYRHALKHPLKHLKLNEHICETAIAHPSASLTNILDTYSSIPILKRVEIYSSLHKQRQTTENSLDLKRNKTNHTAITL